MGHRTHQLAESVTWGVSLRGLIDESLSPHSVAINSSTSLLLSTHVFFTTVQWSGLPHPTQ